MFTSDGVSACHSLGQFSTRICHVYILAYNSGITLLHHLSEHFEIWIQKPPMAERVNIFTLGYLNDFSRILVLMG